MGGAGRIARKGEMRNAYKILVEKPQGKRPLWRTRGTQENSIEMNIKEWV
jgi:hypothetical protein